VKRSSSAKPDPDPIDDSGVDAVVTADALREFANLVVQLGGDPGALLAKASIDPHVLTNRRAVIEYLSFVKLLKQAASELSCRDFGMRLAVAQEVGKVLGPLDVAMRNAVSLCAALAYCAENIQVCSVATPIFVEEQADHTSLLHLRIALPRSLLDRQVVEHALLLTQHNVQSLSGGNSRAREIWFAHEPGVEPKVYERYFGAPVRFEQAKSGLLLSSADLDRAIPGADPQLYALATYFIRAHFPEQETDLTARVSSLIEPLLQEGRCTPASVAAALGIGQRVLQRRLRAAGTSFESIRDEVRREMAARYLKRSDLSLMRIAEALGYSDTAVLTKSCYRWFSASPRQIRTGKVRIRQRAKRGDAI
jgi:AraC-like DNA-binding protein